MNSEEVDLQRRLRERGLPSVVLAGPTAVHAGGGSSDSARRREWLVQSRLAYADKWGGRRRLQAALGAATAANLAWNTGRRLAGRDVAPLRTVSQEAALLRRGGQRGCADEPSGVSSSCPRAAAPSGCPSSSGCLERQTHDDFEVVVVARRRHRRQRAGRWLRGPTACPSGPWCSPSTAAGRPRSTPATQDAKGDVLVRCDDDLAPGPDYVRLHAAAHEAGPAGVVGHVPQRVPGDGVRPRLRPPGLRAVPRGRPRRARLIRAGATGAATSRSTAIPGSASAPTTRATAATAGRTSTGATACTAPACRSPSSPGSRPTTTSPPPRPPAGRCVPTTPVRPGAASRPSTASRWSRPTGRDPWNLAVGAAARLLNERGIGRAGRAVDRLADRLPRWVAEKAVALTVEAGALAGYRRSDAGQAI